MSINPKLIACGLAFVSAAASAQVQPRYQERAFFDEPKARQRDFARELVSATRFDIPNTRTAAHGPWFVQFRITRRSPGIKSSIPIPRHRVAAITIGTEF